MKKLLLSISAWTFSACLACAQNITDESLDASSLKPQQKSFATELNVNPFNGQLSLNNSLNQLKFRYFTSPNLALRLGLAGKKVSTVKETNTPYGTNPNQFKDNRSSLTLGLNLGVEKHFTGTKRLSPYIGADLAVSNRSSSQEIKDGNSESSVTGGWVDYIYLNSNPNFRTQQILEPGYFSYGLNLVTGFDYYMAKSFFFGYEFNFGFTKTNHKELEITTYNTNGGNNTNNNNSDWKNSTFTFGPNLLNGMRIGYIF